MQTVTLPERRAAIARQRESDFEAYHSWELQRRYDEITDVAERVRAPIAPKQEFMLTAEGLVSERGETLRPVIVKGLAEAQRMALTNPDWRVEVIRRTIDLQEYDELETLAMQGEGSGALVSYWLIPDEIRSGANTGLPGYNRERLKMFTRIAVPTAKGVAIKYHSYDGSYLPGVQSMDEAIGFTFDPNRTSEQIAGERRRIPVPVDIDALDEVLRQAYDGALARDFGGEWDGGRPPLAVKDIIAFICGQEKLLDEHMGEVVKVFAQTANPHKRNTLMEPHRYNLAAAIDDLLHGKEVTSAAEAGEAARDEGRNLDGDCPTGDDTAQSELEKLGFKTAKTERSRVWAAGECRTCLQDKAIDITGCNMCLDCENAHNVGGNALLNGIMRDAQEKRARQLRAAALRRKKMQAAGNMVINHAQTVVQPAK